MLLSIQDLASCIGLDATVGYVKRTHFPMTAETRCLAQFSPLMEAAND